MFVRLLCEHCAENGSQIGWKVSELQAVFQSCLFSTFTAFPCSRYSTGKPVVLSQPFPAHFTRIQQYSPLQDVFSQLNKEDGSRIEGKKKRYLVNFSTNPDIARHRIIINSNYYSAIYSSKYRFHSSHFSLKFCARHSCTSVLQKCAKTSIVCVSCIILPAVSFLRIYDCGEVNLGLLGAAFPGVTDLVMDHSSLVEGSAGGSGDLFPRLQRVELFAVEGLSAPLGAVVSSGKWRRSGRKQSVKQSVCARWCCA